jgi:asparagine synthetase B (glutamine-hydrolysing)
MRHPFLAAEVLNYVTSVPLDYKMDPLLPPGAGDKLLLRIGAHRLGLELASGRKKRAMQFGSRSARMENKENEKKGHCIVLAE